MKLSKFFFKTTKESRSEASLISHDLMLRSCMIQQNAAGLYSFLPLGLICLQKVVNIIQEEMNEAGALEILMPFVQPANLWEQSGRWHEYGKELLRFEDRHSNSFCLSPTAEEMVCDVFAQNISSYKNLPLNIYQINTKFRDEIRPRFGVMRAREFLMKDAYSFHLTKECLHQEYLNMKQTYCNILDRLQLSYKCVQADSGTIGGNTSEEFQIIADSGENTIAFCPHGDYAANIEEAAVINKNPKTETKKIALIKTATPKAKTIEDVCEFLNITPDTTLKVLILKATTFDADEHYVAAALLGCHNLNDIKLKKALKLDNIKDLDFATDKEIAALDLIQGSIGPLAVAKVHAAGKLHFIADKSAELCVNLTAGADERDYHIQNFNWDNLDTKPAFFDIRNIEENDLSPDGKGRIMITKGIEVGHIFQLGKKYSEKANINIQNEKGEKVIPLMGCYGVGVSRIIAAAIEQNHDATGIIWNNAMAPFLVIITPIGYNKNEQVAAAADKLYNYFKKMAIDVLLDDRGLSAGVMFKDADLIGIPNRITISPKTLETNSIEFKKRAEKDYQAMQINNLEEITCLINS